MIKPTSTISQSIVLAFGIFLAAASVAIAPVVAEAQQVKKGKKGKKGKKANKGKKGNKAGKKQAGKKKAGKKKAAKKVKAIAPPAAQKKVVIINQPRRVNPRLVPDKSDFMKRLYGNSVGGSNSWRSAPNARWQGSPRKVVRAPEPVYKKRVVKQRNRPIVNKRIRGNRRLGSFDEIRNGKKFRRNIRRNRNIRHNRAERRQRRAERRMKRQILRALDRWF